MALDLAELPPRVDLPAGLEVRRERVASELSGFASVVADLSEPPDSAVRLFYERASPLLLEEDRPMRLFVGYLDGYPVAASELFVGGGGGRSLLGGNGDAISSPWPWHVADLDGAGRGATPR